MDCKTATQVYSSGNPLQNIKHFFPVAFDFLDSECKAYCNKQADSFDTQVKAIVGQTEFDYRIVHRDDKDNLTTQIQELIGDLTSRLLLQDHFSDKYSKQMYFCTMCCSSHNISSKQLTTEESLILQKAAVSL
jgi:hypothetical protein